MRGKKGEVGPPGIGYQLDSKGSYDVKNGSNNHDVVNKQQREYYTDNSINGLKRTLESDYSSKLDSKVDYNSKKSY